MPLTQPTTIGSAYVITFNGLDVPTTAAYFADDGWKRTKGFFKKSELQDYGGNVIGRMGSGAQVQYQGNLKFPQGTFASNSDALKPGASFSMTAVAAGAVTGAVTVYCIVSAVLTGNRDYDEVAMTVIKESSMTYTVA